MKNLTVNQTMDSIISYMDEIHPVKAPSSLYNKLKRLRKIKMDNINGGLLPYAKGREIVRQIAIAKSSALSGVSNQYFTQNFNPAQKFKHNTSHSASPDSYRDLASTLAL